QSRRDEDDGGGAPGARAVGARCRERVHSSAGAWQIAPSAMACAYCSEVKGRPNSGAVSPSAAGALEAMAASSQARYAAGFAPEVELFSVTATVNPVAGSE